ncbi:MAG TPA: hypothetical protein VGJ05_11290 [Fimbriiglobus sp.]
MSAPSRSRLNARRLPALAGFALLATLATFANGEDVVILRDGTILKGKLVKERESIFDKTSGIHVVVDKANGLECIYDGAKWTFFGSHSRQQVGDFTKDEKPQTETDEFRRPARAKSFHDVPPGFGKIEYSKWDKNWHRIMTIRFDKGGYETIEQAITRIDPRVIYVVSVTHNQKQFFATTEIPPAELLALLSTHPDLVEQPGKPDALKRLRKVEFLKDVGKTNPDWLILARSELEKVKKDVPEPWSKEANERYGKLKAEIGRAEAKILTSETERAMQAGRYDAARQYLTRIDPAQASAADLAKSTALKAGLEIIGPRYTRVKELLRTLLDDLTGADKVRPRVAVGGAAGFYAAPGPKLSPDVAALAAAGEVIFRELHPDTASRLDLFKNLAEQAESQKKLGGSPSSKPESLLAVAVSGWIKGKNGADPDVAGAAKGWAARVMCLQYLKEDIANNRAGILRAYEQSSGKVEFDELAQIITLLPPIDPEDPAHLTGEKVPAVAGKVLDGIWKYTLPPTPNLPKGGAYFVRLPDEYHPGRPYPLFIAISHATVPAEQTLSNLAYEANRNGYILVAPEWGDAFNTAPYDYSGQDHALVLATRRDAMRRFQVDTDRVVLFGFGEGGNFATDVAFSHPDRFAALVTFGATPKKQMFREYWQNGQKLPVYAVTGDQAGLSFSSHYEMFKNMLLYGFPSLLVVFQGRGIEWYRSELPVLFDWLANKRRVTGTGTLRVGNKKVLEWRTMRKTDDRFYWIGCPAIDPSQLLENHPKKGVYPAGVYADIRPGNLIAVNSRGLKTITLYLERDMIDWTKPVRVLVNSQTPYGFRAKKIEPSIDFMLEEFVKTGDKKMLFLNKLEFPARQ